MRPSSEYKDISMRTGFSARGKIDRESDKGDSCTEGLVRVCGGVMTWLLHRPAGRRVGWCLGLYRSLFPVSDPKCRFAVRSLSIRRLLARRAN